MQEVKVETLNSSAQFSTPATAIVTTKSGTNQLHGSMFETARNNAIGIAKARQNPANFAAPHLVRNEFGASVGGPISIPKVYDGKNKSFFFFAFERFSILQAANQLLTVPTVAMRKGDFSGLINRAGIQQILNDPNTTQAGTLQRTPFPNNQIPILRQSPLAKAIYAATPLPNSAHNPLGSSNFNAVNRQGPQFGYALDRRRLRPLRDLCQRSIFQFDWGKNGDVVRDDPRSRDPQVFDHLRFNVLPPQLPFVPCPATYAGIGNCSSLDVCQLSDTRNSPGATASPKVACFFQQKTNPFFGVDALASSESAALISQKYRAKPIPGIQFKRWE